MALRSQIKTHMATELLANTTTAMIYDGFTGYEVSFKSLASNGPSRIWSRGLDGRAVQVRELKCGFVKSRHHHATLDYAPLNTVTLTIPVAIFSSNIACSALEDQRDFHGNGFTHFHSPNNSSSHLHSFSRSIILQSRFSMTKFSSRSDGKEGIASSNITITTTPRLQWMSHEQRIPHLQVHHQKTFLM